MTEPAMCQCTLCLRFLEIDRIPDGSYANNSCSECTVGGIPLARLSTAPLNAVDLELLALLAEECAEVIQRVGKILRWGWGANFGGTTQLDKLHVELGDVQAAMALLDYNGVVDEEEIYERMGDKMAKFQEDAAGPRQRLLHAEVPE